jgi:formylglycine-generating enzyme required for sulfatase activity
MRPFGLGLVVAGVMSCARTSPPYGEALVIVDTDAPAPLLAGRLRLDVYSADGTTLETTRDVPRPDGRDWPASFSLYDPDPNAPRDAIVRLRVFPQTKTEPEIPLTIDRLFRLHLEPGVVGSIRLVMRGACFGMPVDVASLQTCVDTEGKYEPVATPALDPDMTRPTNSLRGQFGQDACTVDVRPSRSAADGTPLFDGEACVGGGAFIFGNADGFAPFRDAVTRVDAEVHISAGTPERVVRVTAFRIDEHEVTVGRWHDAIARGLPLTLSVFPDDPVKNEQALAETADPKTLCTFSAGSQNRERYPVNCVSQAAAQAFCRFEGGVLPTEAQWEYVAQVAGRDHKTPYPWGDEPPSCDHGVYGRTSADTVCLSPLANPPRTSGPQAEDDGRADLDVFGISNLSGSVREWMADAFHDLVDPCWASATLTDPRCDGGATDALGSIRGGSFFDPPLRAYAGARLGIETYVRHVAVGFRCVREVR